MKTFGICVVTIVSGRKHLIHRSTLAKIVYKSTEKSCGITQLAPEHYWKTSNATIILVFYILTFSLVNTCGIPENVDVTNSNCSKLVLVYSIKTHAHTHKKLITSLCFIVLQ